MAYAVCCGHAPYVWVVPCVRVRVRVQPIDPLALLLEYQGRVRPAEWPPSSPLTRGELEDDELSARYNAVRSDPPTHPPPALTRCFLPRHRHPMHGTAQQYSVVQCSVLRAMVARGHACVRARARLPSNACAHACALWLGDGLIGWLAGCMHAGAGGP